jgi:hypothetical protein
MSKKYVKLLMKNQRKQVTMLVFLMMQEDTYVNILIINHYV